MKIMCLMFMVLLLSLFMGLLNFLLSEKFKSFYTENYLFECGFESVYWTHNKISSHFFKIGIIFLMFDLEIMLLLFTINNNMMIFEIWSVLLFLTITLWLEMYFKSLLWNN